MESKRAKGLSAWKLYIEGIIGLDLELSLGLVKVMKLIKQSHNYGWTL